MIVIMLEREGVEVVIRWQDGRLAVEGPAVLADELRVILEGTRVLLRGDGGVPDPDIVDDVAPVTHRGVADADSLIYAVSTLPLHGFRIDWLRSELP